METLQQQFFLKNTGMNNKEEVEMIDGSTFTNEERVMLNGVAVGREVATMPRSKCLEILNFMAQACGEEVTSSLGELITKIEGITNEEWEYLRLLMPLEVYAEPDTNEEI